MADIRKKPVIIGVSKLFFKDVFEPERKRFEKKLGVKLSQKNFTEFLARSKVKFKIDTPRLPSFPKNKMMKNAERFRRGFK